jgi:pimeloyl-ACP methyl ester carboxylesterase
MMRARFVTSFDGHPIAYYVFGSGPPLVLSTGIGVDHAGLWPQIEHFARSRRVIAWDYRGVGRSQPLPRTADVSITAHARDLAAVLDAADVRTADLFGWSMGVPVSLELCRREPALARSLILCCAPAGGLLDPFVSVPGVDELASRVLTRSAGVLQRPLARALRLAERSPVLIPAATRVGMIAPEIDRDRWLQQVRSVADCDLHAYVRTMAALTTADATALLPRIAVPSLVIAAERDRVVPLDAMERMAAAIEGAELFVVPGASHYCVIEQPARVNLRVAEHLAEVDLEAR